ncbi:hypothetical protein [Synechococcus sp. GFB01]|uniref:hypothetical protein n=1 Tax=Synechococcus sp. GFB01 TaxID=1662190 RepID=UPI000AC064BE|nr:hypothetical protein [Synechococcus sp. GFB01]
MRLWLHRHRRGLLVGLVLLLALVLPGTGLLLALARQALVRSFGLVVDLIGIGLVLFLIAAFLAPLEALGWWAGWFGDARRDRQAWASWRFPSPRSGRCGAGWCISTASGRPPGRLCRRGRTSCAGWRRPCRPTSPSCAG